MAGGWATQIAAPQHIAVFNNVGGRLHEIWWDGGAWNPDYDHGTPGAEAIAVGVPGSTAFYGWTGDVRLKVYVTGSDGHLYSREWTGSTWLWVDRGVPPGGRIISSPTPVPYLEYDLSVSVRIFALGSGGRLYCFAEWSNGTGEWFDQGLPAGTTFVKSDRPAATSGAPYGDRNIHVFVRDTHGGLWLNHWDGSGWSWESHGTPPGTTISTSASALTVGTLSAGGFTLATHVHAHGFDGHLYVNYQDAGGWHWTDLGMPSAHVGVNVRTSPSVEGNYTGVNAFSVGTDGKMYNNNWSLSNPTVSSWYSEDRPLSAGLSTSPSVITYDPWLGGQGSANPASIRVFFLQDRVYEDSWFPYFWTWTAFAP